MLARQEAACSVDFGIRGAEGRRRHAQPRCAQTTTCRTFWSVGGLAHPEALAMNTNEPGNAIATWHPGEIAMQSSAGVADRMAEAGKRSIRDHLIDQHRQFYPLLPFVVLGAVDRAGNAWATLRGRPGFMRAATPNRLSVQVPRALRRDLSPQRQAGGRGLFVPA